MANRCLLSNLDICSVKITDAVKSKLELLATSCKIGRKRGEAM